MFSLLFSVLVCQMGGWHDQKNLYRREHKGRRCCLGDRIYYSKFLAALVFFSGRFKEQDEFLSSYHSDAINPFLHIILVQNRQRGKEMNKFCPPNSSDDLCLLLCINPSSLDIACYVWPVQKHHIFVYDIKNFIFLMQHVF